MAVVRQHIRPAIVCAVLLAGLLLSLDAIIAVATSHDRAPVQWRWVIAYAPLFVITLGSLAWHLRGWVKKQPPPTWAGLRFLFQLCVVGWLSFVAIARPFDIAKLELAAGMLAGLFAAGLIVFGLWLRPLTVRSPTFARVLRVADTALLNICVIALGLELGLRLVSHINPMPIFARAATTPELNINRNRSQRYTQLTARRGCGEALKA